MEMPAQGEAGYYIWEAEGKAFEVHISLDVIDGLGADILRGFGAVPKRGAEVGGLLLGGIERGAETVVRVDDFELLPCGYKRGPSYLLSPEERETFERAADAMRQDTSEGLYAVGYFRSHTRDGFALTAEDIELLDRCFPSDAQVALLVKPFATKASTAGFFFREFGSFQAATPLEFPFRRRELLGEEAPARRPLSDRGAGGRGRGLARTAREDPRERDEHRERDQPLEDAVAPEPAESLGYAYATTLPRQSRLGGWMWFPLSFIFLLLGVALGYWAALGMFPRIPANIAPEYSLALAAKKSSGGLTVEWNADSPAVRNAERGVLEVRDGKYAKAVDLDAAQLRGGKLAFQNESNKVSFHLTVYLNSRLSVSEALDWRP